MNEHNGGADRVSWRDLDAARDRLLAEFDRRFNDHGKQHTTEFAAAQEALRLAREDLRKAFLEVNGFRAEATADKAKYAEVTAVDAEIAKLEAKFTSDLAAVRTSQFGTSGEVRTLQNAANITKGKDLGLLGLAASMGGVVVYGLQLLFG